MNKEIKITPNGIKQALENLLNENEQLQKEIKILKENAEHNDKVVDKVNWENNLLKGKNKKYKEVINKAIEYIKSYKTDYSPYELSDYNVRQILEILKGDSNE